jgi:hypothetical protein
MSSVTFVVRFDALRESGWIDYLKTDLGLIMR